MRIATSTIYDNQTTTIDNLSAQYQSIGADLSTGISLNAPSDDPSVINQDLTITNTIKAENADASNATAAQNTLTYTDSTLSSLTSILQTARSLAVEGATDIIPNGTQRPLIGKQVAGLVTEAIALANSKYGNSYIFGGTGQIVTNPVTGTGDPPTNIAFSGNNNARTELINGQEVQVGTTLQQAFNFNSTDGSPNVVQLLATLRDTLDQEPASIQSANSINTAQSVIYGPGSGAAQTTLAQIVGPPTLTTTALTADNAAGPGAPYFTITIDGTTPATGAAGSATLTFTGASTIGTILGQINGATATTGVQASWNQQTEKLQLTSVAPNSPSFEINDTATQVGDGAPPATTAATNTSNFLTAFQIPSQVSVTANLSAQLGVIDQVTNAVLSARASVGQQIQNLASTSTQLQAQSNDNTTTQSGYANTNVAQATSQFTLVQTALQAAYATTTRLESKSLMDYLPS